MSFRSMMNEVADDPEQLEQAYQAAVQAGEVEAFQQAIDARRAAAPEDRLYAAWFYRLRHSAVKVKESFIAWGWAIPLALLNGLVLWLLSDDQRFAVTIQSVRPGVAASDTLPMVFLLAAPLSAVFVLGYLTVAGRRQRGVAALIGVALLAAAAYVLLVYPQAGTRPFQEQYLTLMAMHLPLLAWAGVGALLVHDRRDPANRFAFLLKSLEVFVVGGLFVIAGGVFTGITMALFDTLTVDLPEIVQRLFIAGGGGLIPVLAVAMIYNPAAPPAAQDFDEGLGKLVALLPRVLLPLTLVVLFIFVLFVPFNFFEPFENRDVLIIYNAMLFAVVALLTGVTPLALEQVSPRLRGWLRRWIVAVAALAVAISVYALVAILYRTAIDRLTPNRLAFIGWNAINIYLLLSLLFHQARVRAGAWPVGIHRALSEGTVLYAVWTLLMILALPWLFGLDRGQMDGLPPAIQDIIYETPEPILLKCTTSPHIYLLEDGQKRWIDTIATFTDRGYRWADVRFVGCDDLSAVPNGPTIPEGAGPPPQP